MTVYMTDLEILEQIPFMDEDNDIVHVLCPSCNPAATRDQVTALWSACGILESSDPSSVEYIDCNDDNTTCKVCRVAKFCVRCGYEIWSGELP